MNKRTQHASLASEKPIASEESQWLSNTRQNLEFSYESIDPSEHMGFTRPVMDGVVRFDNRTNLVLTEALHEHESSVERERAFWEYMDRRPPSAAKVAREFLLRESDRAVRWGALWAIQKFLPSDFTELALLGLNDDDIELRDWARILLAEVTGNEMESADRPRDAVWIESNPFDQTLPLIIAGYARVAIGGGRFVQATLSPKWFEAILGRVMACTCDETFDKELVIEKQIKEYHPDGSDHYEIYHFTGFTQQITDHLCYHHYEAQARHTFYPSGKVEDTSEPAVDDVIVAAARAAATLRRPYNVDRRRLLVESVRGRYMGYAYTSVERVLDKDMNLGPGEVQLSNLTHPIAGPLTNTLIFGTFRGKLTDWDGDGKLDANTIPCHATRDGRLDYQLDGTNSPDPYDPYAIV